MAKARIRIKAPKSANKGEVIQIKTLVSHKMESGQRKDKQGQTIPRSIINKFIAKFNGKDVFTSDWHPAISANPYLAFHMRVTESGTLEASWTDDDGTVYSQSAEIKVN